MKSAYLSIILAVSVTFIISGCAHRHRTFHPFATLSDVSHLDAKVVPVKKH